MTEMNFSFAGCGFLGIYHAGVAACFKKYAPHITFNHISGASAGALAACSLLCDMSPENYISDVLDVVQSARNRTLGPFSPSFNLNEAVKTLLHKVIPQNAHIKVKDKLRVSLTRVRDGKNVIISEFHSREDLIECLLVSSFVPVFSGMIPPKFRGERCMDGMFTDNLPRVNKTTITVSPFCGESDICPENNSNPFFHMKVSNMSVAMSFQNLVNFFSIVWPPKTEVLAELCKQGFNDALRFLQKNNHISCTRCLSIESTFVISEEDDETTEFDPQCEQCEEHRQEASGTLPQVMDNIFQNYIDAANKGLYNWLLSNKGMRVISILTLPYTLPLDCAYAVLLKMKNIVPHMVGNLRSMIKFLMEELLGILEEVSSKAGYKLSATLKMDYDIGSDGQHFTEKEIKIDFHVEDRNLDVAKLKSSDVLSRRGSSAMKSEYSADDNDTYENVLEVTSHHDSVLAYYYTDEQNKLRVTEIFEVSNPEPTENEPDLTSIDQNPTHST